MPSTTRCPHVLYFNFFFSPPFFLHEIAGQPRLISDNEIFSRKKQKKEFSLHFLRQRVFDQSMCLCFNGIKKKQKKACLIMRAVGDHVVFFLIPLRQVKL